jgi:pyruvate/2-oxoglutarate dehydrogenase complex dihydrolipoamide dehydrogenase (E3) component
MKSKTVKIERKSVLLENGESVKGDAVLLSAGVRPNTSFLKNAGIAVDKGILVNEKMETNNPDIYSAGDCCQTKSIITKTPMNALLAVPAYRQGTIAGVNSAGGNARYKGALATCVVKMSDIESAATGFTKSYAEFLDIPVETGKIKGTDTASWYPNAKELVLKIIVDKNSERVIGAQAVGPRAADKINVIATAIKAGMTAEDISQLELAYCPSVSDAYDIITAAAEIVLRKLKR